MLLWHIQITANLSCWTESWKLLYIKVMYPACGGANIVSQPYLLLCDMNKLEDDSDFDDFVAARSDFESNVRELETTFLKGLNSYLYQTSYKKRLMRESLILLISCIWCLALESCSRRGSFGLASIEDFLEGRHQHRDQSVGERRNRRSSLESGDWYPLEDDRGYYNVDRSP